MLILNADDNIINVGNIGGSNYTIVLKTAIIGAPTKVYDGTVAAALASGNYNVYGQALGDTFTVGQTSGTYNSKDVASATTVSAALTGGDFTPGGGNVTANYTFPVSASGAGSITPAALTASITAPNKVYNGNTTAAPTFTITGGEVGTETVTATGTATFNTKDVLTANLVTANTNVLANGTNGGLASNYSLATGQTVAANITPASVTIAGTTANNKVYTEPRWRR